MIIHCPLPFSAQAAQPGIGNSPCCLLLGEKSLFLMAGFVLQGCPAYVRAAFAQEGLEEPSVVRMLFTDEASVEAFLTGAGVPQELLQKLGSVVWAHR